LAYGPGLAYGGGGGYGLACGGGGPWCGPWCGPYGPGWAKVMPTKARAEASAVSFLMAKPPYRVLIVLIFFLVI